MPFFRCWHDFLCNKTFPSTHDCSTFNVRLGLISSLAVFRASECENDSTDEKVKLNEFPTTKHY